VTLFPYTTLFRSWYNIYEIHAREDGSVRGYYCNISRPAQIGAETISYVDLALDLLVYPDGRQLVLDEDEFAALPLSAAEREQAIRALGELQAGFTAHVYPPVAHGYGTA
jgi:protein associated with RNAse G/E